MDQMDSLFLSRAVKPLLQWYEGNARVLPWRQEPTPYRVWISEIMLQQTRVSAVMPYFNRWMDTLPEIIDLANADEETLLKLWEGLGYYNRVRNLHKAAKEIVTSYGGKMPSSYDQLLHLPGIGEYTAGAISSIAFGKDEVAVDGNVLRVISRILGSFRDIKDPKTKREIQNLLRCVLPEGKAGSFNQALMELGATVCLPNGAPQCLLCPWVDLCRAHEVGNELMIPVKAPKKKRKQEERTILILISGGKVAIQKRPEHGLLASLWELPSHEGKLAKNEVFKVLKSMGLQADNVQETVTAKHVFTHIEWHMTGYVIYLHNMPEGYTWAGKEQLQSQYALPSAFRSYRNIIDELIR